jgi:hypothetical protein
MSHSQVVAVLISQLRDALPTVVSRKAIEKQLSGLISHRTLANLDSLGKGPAERVRFGRSVGYPKEAFLSWLATRLKEASDA